MPKNKKKLWVLGKFLIILSIIYIIATVSVKLQSTFVKKEFKDFEKIAYLIDYDFRWKEKDYNIINFFESKDTMWGYNYVVTPLVKFYARWPYSPGIQYKLEMGYPERTLNDIFNVAVFIYPTNELNKKNKKRSAEQEISFDKGYSLSEVEEEFGFDSMIWLWVDTYGNTDSNQFEYFTRRASLDNCAYGIPCSGYDSLESAAEAFVAILNEYQDKKKSATEKYLYKIKIGIKEEGELTIDDLVIIGGVFNDNFNEESSMIKVLNPEIELFSE